MGRKRRTGRLVGGACLAVAALAVLWPGRQADPQAIDGRDNPLDARVAASHRKLVLKTGVVNELIAGRLTLAGAVDRFEEIERQFPELAERFRHDLEAVYRGPTFRVRLAHSILAYCEARLRHLPDRADVVLARLHAELASFVRSQGGDSPGWPETPPPSGRGPARTARGPDDLGPRP